MAPGWHTYSKDPGDSGLPTKIRWRLPDGFAAGEIQWPVPKRIETPPLVNFGYEDTVSLLVQLTPPSSLAGEKAILSAQVTWLECKDVCVPGKADVSLTVPVSSQPSPPTAEMASFFAEARARLPAGSETAPSASRDPPLSLGFALLLAFLGGLLLNLMPCVLPVLSIKFLGFLETPRETLRKHGLLYGAGVLLSFLVLAGLLIVLRAGGEKLGWGFQLQSPVFVGFLGALFFALGLNLLGVFEIGTSLVGLGGFLGGKSSRNAFLSGVLAVLVATPCTAPFMGPALGYALTQSALSSLIIFCSLGFGLAFPYVLLSFFPVGLRWIPKPGAWMLTLKQGMAFLFFGTSLWMVWVLGLQRGTEMVSVLLLIFLGISVGAWLAGPVAERARSDVKRIRVRRVGVAVAVLSALGLWALGGPATERPDDHRYSQAKVDSLLAEGRPVFVDFTAAWCITCQVNERTTLSSSKVREAFRKRNVAVLVADWTNRDPDITRALEQFGRNGVPLYVLYSARGERVVLPAVLTPDIVLKALDSLQE